MKRALLVFGIIGLIAVVLVAFWALRTPSATNAQQTSLKTPIESAMTNAVSFAKNHFTGGIGAVLTMDPKTGGPMINQVMTNSPAAAAGLLKGDHIVQIDGVSTSGQKLSQIVEKVRGFTVSSVTLTIQRAGSTTNMDFILSRSSWERLGVPQSSSPSSPQIKQVLP